MSSIYCSKESTITAPKKMNILCREIQIKTASCINLCTRRLLNSGRARTYLLGRNFARKGVVVVILDYTLSPNTDYNGMAKQIVAEFNGLKTNKHNPNEVLSLDTQQGDTWAHWPSGILKYGIYPKKVFHWNHLK
jgi:hypothetical protein